MITKKAGTIASLLSLSLVAWAGPGIAATDPPPLNPVTQTLPVYKPPKDFVPGGRLSVIPRGDRDDAPRVLVLAPDHVGLTKSKLPVLYWYLSKSTNLSVEFSLVDSRAIAPILEVRLPSPHEAGVHAIRLSDYKVSLVPGVPYRWFVSLIRDPEASSRDIVAGAVFEHVTMIEALFYIDAIRSHDVNGYAEAGLWYDAIRAVSELIERYPREKIFRLQRAALLEQVGLKEIAQYDSGK